MQQQGITDSPIYRQVMYYVKRMKALKEKQRRAPPRWSCSPF